MKVYSSEIRKRAVAEWITPDELHLLLQLVKRYAPGRQELINKLTKPAGEPVVWTLQN